MRREDVEEGEKRKEERERREALRAEEEAGNEEIMAENPLADDDKMTLNVHEVPRMREVESINPNPLNL